MDKFLQLYMKKSTGPGQGDGHHYVPHDGEMIIFQHDGVDHIVRKVSVAFDLSTAKLLVGADLTIDSLTAHTFDEPERTLLPFLRVYRQLHIAGRN